MNNAKKILFYTFTLCAGFVLGIYFYAEIRATYYNVYHNPTNRIISSDPTK